MFGRMYTKLCMLLLHTTTTSTTRMTLVTLPVSVFPSVSVNLPVGFAPTSLMLLSRGAGGKGKGSTTKTTRKKTFRVTTSFCQSGRDIGWLIHSTPGPHGAQVYGCSV